MVEERKKRGRFEPRPYDSDTAKEICIRIADGESLRAICRDDPEMPSRSQVFEWLKENKDFQVMYATARGEQADAIFDEIIDIADNGPGTPEERRIAIDARKWAAGKLRPKKYGDATLLKHADADGERITLAGILGELDGGTKGLPGAEGKAG